MEPEFYLTHELTNTKKPNNTYIVQDCLAIRI